MEPWTDGAPLILRSELLYQPHERMEPGSDGTLTSELLHHPELQRCNLKLTGAILVLKPELLYHAELRGWPLYENSELLYHPELTGWSLGLMGGPGSQNQVSYHLEPRGCNLRLMGCLSYHRELSRWSLGLMERP